MRDSIVMAARQARSHHGRASRSNSSSSRTTIRRSTITRASIRTSPANYRRSVYRFIVRSVPDPLMERFDCPDVSMITAKRTTTITAIQALALLNNPFVLKQAEHLAERARAAGVATRFAIMSTAGPCSVTRMPKRCAP